LFEGIGLASRGKNRVEPGFESNNRRGSADFSVSDSDRAAPRRKRGRAKKSRSSRGRRGATIFGRMFYWAFILCIWAGIGVAAVVGYYGSRMPSATTWAVPDRAPNVKILGVGGKLIANRGTTGGEAMGLHEMSPYLPQAVVAIEDRRFYSHFGFDPIGFGRAMVRNVMAGRMVQGGSTLTQQLAKNLFLKPDRTLERKVQEVLLAVWLEHKYTKDEILEMYLNRVYFGSNSYGVEAASRRYFGKSSKNISLQQAALLAGLLKAPSRLSPANDAKAANDRAEIVMAAMRDQGMIGDKELGDAVAKPVSKAAAYWTGSENYVADAVMRELPALIGEVKQDVIVDTTIDLSLQKSAEKSIKAQIAKNAKTMKVRQGALVSIDGTGAVRALVGGRDYSGSQFNRATEARRQPGSAFKPFVYLAALEAGRTPNSVRNDAPIQIGNWTPDNYEGRYLGDITLTEALAKSSNSVAAQLAMEVGPDAVIEAASRLGVRSPLAANQSLALGTSEVTLMEMTGAFASFSNGGYSAPVHIIKRVTTVDGAVLYENTYDGAKRVIQPEIAGMMNRMMSRTLTDGTGKKAAFGWPAAGKTGTSQDYHDAWFVGYTANLTTGVWFGNDDNSPMKKVTGGSIPALVWKDFMTAAHKGVEVASLPGTNGFAAAPINVDPAPAAEPLLVKRPEGPVANSGKARAAAPANRPSAAATLTGKSESIPVRRPPAAIGTSGEMTGSTRHPIPKADIGKRQKAKETTIMDLIMAE
jgi:penicillin-binding protein 1A